MSELRRHLESVRNDHLSARYPGDLAELLPPERSFTGALRRTAVAGVALAAVMLLVIRVSVLPLHVEPTAQTGNTKREGALVSLGTFPEWPIPSQPEEFPFAPEVPSFAFPTPTFPSFDELQPSNLTTEEATRNALLSQRLH